MADFNTHGGYFAPAGYLRINTGGKHEENPNGGVQLGVDQQGVPNLVEEDETVYKDFVFSDNIKAKGGFLKDAGLPMKYEGWFYNKIVDDLFTEAEDRPYDPISRNGLDAMLSRAAQAQEAQKHAEEEEALIKELQQMSPEDVAALEAELAQGAPVEEEPMQEAVAAPEPVVGPELEPMPMMAKGGPLRKTLNTFFNGAPFVGPDGTEYPLNKMEVWASPGKANPERIAKASSDVAKWGKEVKELRNKQGFFAPYGSIAMRNLKAAKSELWNLKGGPQKLAVGVTSGLGAIGMAIGDSLDGTKKERKEKAPKPQYNFVEFDEFGNGGKVNRFDLGSQIQLGNPFIKLPSAEYDKWGVERFLPDDYASYWGRIHAPLLGSPARPAVSNTSNTVTPIDLGELGEVVVTGNALRPGSGVYSASAGAGTGAASLPYPDIDLDTIIQNADNEIMSSVPVRVETDADRMIPLPAVNNMLTSWKNPANPVDGFNARINALRGNPGTGILKKFKSVLGGGNGSNDFDIRLLSPLMDAAMGLTNLAMPADHYDYTPIRPYLPSGKLRQQYERYNPIDQNIVTNQMIAQANANARALRNSGLGPSLGANLLAADFAANQNLGNALTNVWDANNQRRNQVIAQNNAADAAVANFDWTVDSTRANILNQIAPYNQRMALTVQQLNNAAEQDKYNAVAASLNSGKKFFNDYGWELMNRNMVNTDRANLGYGIDRMNRVIYDNEGNPIIRFGCGGTLLKAHKKK